MQAAGQGAREGVLEIPRLRFESGESLRGLRIGYATWGELNEARDNAVLLLPGTSGSRRSFDGYIGPGRGLDPARWFLIAVDALGGGASSQPADGLGAAFPRYGIRDMVAAHRELLAGAFGAPPVRLHAIVGASMGSFQALEWAIADAQAARRIALLVPSARAQNGFRLVVRTLVELIKLDPRWNGGAYSSPPLQGIRAAAMHYFPWAVTDSYIDSLKPAALEGELRTISARFALWDAWSLIRRFEASSAHDVSLPFGGDLRRALSRIQAKALVLAASSDRLLGVAAARELARLLPGAVYAEIPTSYGHLAWHARPGSPETAFIAERLARFLEDQA